MIPKVMANCWRATRLPRTSGGASSALWTSRERRVPTTRLRTNVLVEWDGHGERSYTDTSDEPTAEDGARVEGSRLDDDTDAEDTHRYEPK